MLSQYLPLILISAIALFMHGCATHPAKQSEPQKPKLTVTETQAPQIRAYRAAEKHAVVVAKPNRSVILLTERATTQQLNGNLQGATKTLQRAIRIAPKNASVWHQLAKVRFAQNHYQQAEQLAIKSNTLAQQNPLLKIKNWRLIAQIYQAHNKPRRAAWAIQQAKRLQSAL